MLIVNADDCNLTEGVTQAILDCHDRGIVSSTTWLMNLPVLEKGLREVRRRKGLGVGIHLNLTLKRPVSPLAKVKSLVDKDGNFHRLPIQTSRFPKAHEAALEYENQVKLFQKVFGCKPTHFDTHHQLHDLPFYFDILVDLAKRFRVPIRRSRCMLSQSKKLGSKLPWRTTDYFFGNFTPAGYWQKIPLENVIAHLPEGISEIMCHPGYLDSDLKAISSFTAGRVEELRLLSSPNLRKQLSTLGIQLGHFGSCRL